MIVIGVGMAGQSVAKKTSSAGKRVAVVDSRPYGGTCALRGCDPKKVLVGAAEVMDWQRRMTGHGLAGEAHIDWGELMAFKRTFTVPVPRTPRRTSVSWASLPITAQHASLALTACRLGRTT